MVSAIFVLTVLTGYLVSNRILAIGVSLLALPIGFFIIDRMVLRRVELLIGDVSHIRDQPEKMLRLPDRGGDELGRVSAAVNELLDELDRSQGQLRYDALHDSLTGLGNRQLLLDSLAVAQARQAAGVLPRFSLLLLDLDGFKDINDLHGHLVGDRILKMVADRLTGSIRIGDTATRLGGDEFAMLIQSSDSANSEGLAKRLLTLIAQPLKYETRTLQVFVSIGILDVTSCPNGDTPDDLLRRADMSMYAAKHAGRNGYRYFSDDMQIALSERKALEGELRLALERDELEVWYQPVLSGIQDRIVSVEALSRWTHKQRGIIHPAMFVPLAEEMHIIPTLDQMVLRKACQLLPQLRRINPDLTISVNLSVLTLMQPEIAEFIAGLLRENDLPGSALLLEVTETALARNEKDLRAPMATLRHLGVRFQIDDFGTGYSSLSRLHLLPLDIVKIDRSFVAELEHGDDRMCQAIIRLAQLLEMSVIAEGVESHTQRDSLIRLGCDEMQGFLYSRPVTAATLLEKIAGDFADTAEA
jgi:diguanylate cyclase (GGDEF)-like protein